MEERPRTRPALAWAMWLVTFGCCAVGLLVTLAIYRPLTAGELVEGAVYALFFALGFGTMGLVQALRRPANPIGWLYAAAGLAWAHSLLLEPWADQLIRERRPLPLVAQITVATADLSWAPAVALGITLPALLLPNGRLRSRRWRLVVDTSATGTDLTVVAGALAPGPLEERGSTTPRTGRPGGERRRGAVSKLSAAIPQAAPRRTAAPCPATCFSRADAVLDQAAEGLVKWCGWHGMQGLQGPTRPPWSSQGMRSTTS